MVRYFYKSAIFSVLDILFCWISWTGSVYAFTYLFSEVHASLLIQSNWHVLMGGVRAQFWVIFVSCVFFYMLCGVHKSLWQHPGIGSIIRLATAVILVSFSVYFSLRIKLGFWPNPGLGVMSFYFQLSFSFAIRIYKKIGGIVVLYMRRFFNLPENTPQEPVKTLLVGAGESASSFILHDSQHGARPRKIMGIVENDKKKHGYNLHGVRILGDDNKIPELVKQFEINEIVVAVPSMKNDELRRIVRLAPMGWCKVRLLSSLSSDKAGDMLRDINIGDLLGRAETNLGTEGLQNWIKGKTALVTGGGGSIGSELCRQLLRYGIGKIVIFDISENNAYNLSEKLSIQFGKDGLFKTAVRIGSVQDYKRLDEVFGEYRPSIVFHAAAYKHVPLMENCPRLALENNVRGTYLTAQAACRHGVERFVMISTDKAVNPTNVMGASKRMAELLVLGQNSLSATEFVCVRFGNVLDSNGSVIPKFKRQIKNGAPVTVTHPEMIRYFMTIPEAARLVIEAGAMANGGEIFILDMGQPVRIKDLAENLIRMAGLTPDVDIKIEYTGLRPGEKLYEELLLDEEGLTKTRNDKIFVVRPVPSPDYDELAAYAAGGFPNMPAPGEIHRFIKHFVPEYKYKTEGNDVQEKNATTPE